MGRLAAGAAKVNFHILPGNPVAVLQDKDLAAVKTFEFTLAQLDWRSNGNAPSGLAQ